MKIETVRDAFLSDYEVLQFLSKLQRKHQWVTDGDIEMTDSKSKWRKPRPYNHPELQSITRDTVNYLSMNKETDPEDAEQPASQPTKSGITRLNDEKFTILMRKLGEFDLYKLEKLQIVNQLPTNVVHLFSIVEECDSRYSEEQISAIIEAVQEAST
ncbi:HGL183Wp [Eremothecium sinecaudum]|uniref:DNA-directed RNA polymerase III subunit RPC9 n=1 Tax=Eremothecium sinecaudum TaxID=45286 RepID=A0A109V015_9SACH|nr:HGL183Wp [Eremothecium sinecaudum]AMD22157.1 HGL183Wp [Eremothecium sinecaudum]